MSSLSALRRRTRNVAVAGGSLIALLAVTLFLVAPSSTALTLSAQSTSASVPHHAEVVYGKFTNLTGKPVSGARVVISHVVRHHRVRVGYAVSNSRGVYRAVLHTRRGLYTARVREHVAHKTYSAARSIRIRPGHAYELSGRLKKNSVFSFLPISSY